jgi:hypothetical protein
MMTCKRNKFFLLVSKDNVLNTVFAMSVASGEILHICFH